MTNLTYKVWVYNDYTELWMGTIYMGEKPIKYLFNHPTEKSCIDRCEAYIRHVKIKPNPAKGMEGSFFINDVEGERLVWVVEAAPQTASN